MQLLTLLLKYKNKRIELIFLFGHVAFLYIYIFVCEYKMCAGVNKIVLGVK